jgi:hypothetical protein
MSFQALYHPESIYPVKAPTAQFTRIHAGHRLFSVGLTRVTSVPECAVPSVGFLWGSAAVSRSCGVSVGLAEAPGWSGRPNTEHQVPQLRVADDHFPSDPASPEVPAHRGNSLPNRCERIHDRVAAVDVAKDAGMVCTRTPHPSRPGALRSTVWTVKARMGGSAAEPRAVIPPAMDRPDDALSPDPAVHVHGSGIWGS